MLGAGLLLDGALLLAFGLDGRRPNVLHVVSGAALLAIGALARGGHGLRAVWASIVFGAFYVALGVVGLTLDRPFGVQLGPGENAFHFTVGLVALLLSGWALRTAAPAPSLRAAQPAASRTAPANRPRAHRRSGKARGGQRRR